MPNAKRKTPVDIESLARAYTDVSIRTLGGIAKDGTSESARVQAATALLDRGWGRPRQDNSHAHAVSGEVRVILRKMLSDDDE